MGNACSSCCNKGGRRAGGGRRKEKAMTEPSPIFPMNRRGSGDSNGRYSGKRGSFDASGNSAGVGLLLPGGGGSGGGNGSPFTASTTAAPSASATPRSMGGGGRGDGSGEKRLSLGGGGINSVLSGGVPATLSLDPLAGVATVVKTGSNGGAGGGCSDHHSGGGGGGAMRSFVSRIPPLGRSGSGEFRNVSESKISTFFCKYRDSSTSGTPDEAITTEGVEQLCKDLDLRPEEFRVLILAWKCRAAQMCRFSRAEFCRGCRALRADTARALQSRLSDASAEALANPELFKDLYRFTYSFGLEPAQKVLPAEMACSLWQLVFNPARQPAGVPPLLPRWIAFVREHPEQVRGIPRDTWNMFLNLTESPAGASGDLSLYDDEEAWPTLFDDFVEYENDRANQNHVNKKWQD